MIILRYFMEGGPIFMSVLTVLLVGLFFAAWKAPRWVKEIGIFALVFGFLGMILGIRQVFTYMQEVSVGKGEISGLFDLIPARVFFGGISITMIPVIYGIIIYLVSLVVRVIQKPRL